MRACSRPWSLGAAAALVLACQVGAQQTVPVHETGIKFMRDSEEYAALARQTYRLATEAVVRGTASTREAWAVVLDVDETTLDNSTYELERAAYGQPFQAQSFDAWAERREAAAVPGAVAFVTAVRSAGGHVAWITNRDAMVQDATRDNLRRVGLWSDNDRLCAEDAPARTKRVRRAEVVTGMGACSWGTPMRVVAFVGDHLTDFPAADEGIPGTGTDEAFGRSCFLLPNSMYGDWETRATRVRSATK